MKAGGRVNMSGDCNKSNACPAERWLLDFQHHHRLIVKDRGPGGELVGGMKDGVCNFLCTAVKMLGNNVLHAGPAKLFVIGVARVNNAVTQEDESIIRGRMDGDLVVSGILKHS